MKLHQSHIILLVFCLSNIGIAFANRQWTPQDEQFNGIPVEGSVRVEVQTQAIGHHQFRFSDPAVTREENIDLNGRSWTYVSIDGEGFLWQAGAPKLPSINRAIRLPNTGNVELRIGDVQYEDYPNIDVMPQPTELEQTPAGDDIFFKYAYDETIYTCKLPFPESIATLSEPAIMRDARVAVLEVHPVQYFPAERTLRVYRSIELEVIPTGGIGQNELVGPHRPVPSFASMYRDVIGAEDLVLEAEAAPPGQILIIARNSQSVRTILQPFIDWKTASGRKTQVLAPEGSGSNENNVKNVIISAYNSWNPPLEFVLLVGDGGTSGDYMLPAIHYTNLTPPPAGPTNSDHYYMMLAGTDYLADVPVGRFCVENQQQLATCVNRTIGYERNPSMTDTTWFMRGWGYAGVQSTYSNRQAIRYCMSMMEQHGADSFQYDEHTGSVNESLINQRIGQGVRFWAHRPSYNGQIYPTSVDQVTNDNKPFVGMNITCNSGDWYGAGVSGIHEQLIRDGTPSSPRGAIASMSTATSGTHINYNNVVATGCYYGVGPMRARQPAFMYLQGKFQLWRNYFQSEPSSSSDFTYWNNMMGDVSANVWNGVPQYLSGVYPDTIAVFQNRLEITVSRAGAPVNDALVCAWKKNEAGVDETYSIAITDSLGTAILPLTNLTSGNLILSVTGNKYGISYYPIYDTIAVVSRPVELSLRTVAIDDDSTNGTIGNNNHVIEPGETVDLDAMLANFGGRSTTAGISGQMQSSNPWVSITTNTSTWRTLAVNDSAFGASRFRMSIASGVPNNTAVPLRLTLTSSDPEANIVCSVPVTVSSIDVSFVSDSLYSQTGTPISTIPIGGNAMIRAWVNNRGIAAGATVVTLFSRNSALTVMQPTAILPALATNQTVVTPNDQRFEVYCSLQTVPGTIGTLGLALVSGTKIDTVYFSVPLGVRVASDPTGPDEYGYRAYDDTDTAYSLHPTFDWVEIIPNNGGSGVRLALTDGGEDQDQSLFYQLPFPVQYYGRTFDSITVCTNGWITFGVERLATAPQYNNFRNWHLPANEGPRNLVAVFWDDLKFSGAPQGVFAYNDTANHRFVITWNVVTMYSPSPPNEFQLIIYDQRFLPTQTHDAIMRFQYKRFNNVTSQPNDTDYGTIGIADNDYLRAVEYSYENHFTSGSSPIASSGTTGFANRAIVFSPGSRIIFGSLQGRITRALDSAPIAGAQISVAGLSQVSDSAGYYFYREVPVGSQFITVLSNGYNFVSQEITITEGDTLTANFAMTSPGYRVSVDSIRTALDVTGQDTTIRFSIHNTGDGLLTYSLNLLYGGVQDRIQPQPIPPSTNTSAVLQKHGPARLGTDEIEEVNNPWDEVFSFAASTLSGDMNLNGVEFDGNNFWVTGSNTWLNPNKLYKFDRNGILLSTFNQPDSTSTYGWRDLAWDGSYLYASSDRNINQIDTLGNIVRSFETNVNPARAIACDTANGLLYYCDRLSQIYAIRISDGQTVAALPNTGNIYGLAWYSTDADGMKLYSLQRDANQVGAQVVKIDPTNGAHQLVATIGNAGENASGVALTPRWNPMLWTLVSVLSNDAGADRIVLHEVAFNTVWIQYAPLSGEIAVGDSAVISIHLSSDFMPVGLYRVGIQMNTNAVPATVVIPVTMEVIVNGVEDRPVVSTLPNRFRLEQNYPNPFNPITTIEFALPQTQSVKLTIHNLLGEEVARLADGESYRAGTYRFTFDARTLASGVYYYHFQSGSFNATRKMILMK